MAALVETLFISFFLMGFISCDVSKRKITTVTWPDCEHYPSCTERKNSSDFLNVVYTKASTSAHDNLYYVFSTISMPTIVLAHTTGEDADLQFDWNKLLQINSSETIEDAIKFDFKKHPKLTVHYKFGVAFTKLIEYNDVDDDADIESCAKNKKVQWNIRPFNTIKWMDVEDQAGKAKGFVFNTTDDGLDPNQSNNGSMSFSFNIQSTDGRGSELPRLKHTANETLFDFVIANYTPSYNHSRFALEAIVVSLSSNDMSIDTTRTIDDEYAPGVFTITDWLTNPKKENVAGFFQWKPVCYFSKSRGRQEATKVEHSTLTSFEHRENDTHLVNNSIIAAFFGKDLWQGTTRMTLANVSFGQPKDGFYVKNNYTVWTAAVGYGSPPKDGISQTVIIIISAGLGLPVIIIIFGGIWAISRRLCRRSQYSPINGDAVSRNQPQVN